MTVPTKMCGCGARIRWVELDGGRVPIDIAVREPGPGRVGLNLKTGRAGAITAGNLERARAAVATGTGWHVYDRHHSTCPDVAKHRVPRSQGTLL